MTPHTPHEAIALLLILAGVGHVFFVLAMAHALFASGERIELEPSGPWVGHPPEVRR